MATESWNAIARANGLDVTTYRLRVRKGWSRERAATEPQHFERRGPWLEHGGQPVLALVLAHRHGVADRVYRKRLAAGWPPYLAATTPSPYTLTMDGRCCLDLVETGTGLRPAFLVAHENGVAWKVVRQRRDREKWSLLRACTEPVLLDSHERCRRARAAVTTESRKRGAHVTAMQRVAGKVGTLYAFHLPETRRIKIGFTVQDVEAYRRHRQLHAMQRVEAIGVAPGTGEDEARWHEQMAEWRIAWLGNETYEATPEALHAAAGFLESLNGSAVRASS